MPWTGAASRVRLAQARPCPHQRRRACEAGVDPGAGVTAPGCHARTAAADGQRRADLARGHVLQPL